MTNKAGLFITQNLQPQNKFMDREFHEICKK